MATLPETTLFQYAKAQLADMYARGKDLESTPLKAFSGPALETFSRSVILEAAKIAGLDMREIKISQDYIKDPEKILDNQRLDQHLVYKDAIILFQEDRAWIDKPFYTLKRAVVHTFLTLPYTKAVTHPDAKFFFQSFSADVTPATIRTMDQVFLGKDQIEMFQLNGYRRGKFKNWFIGGFSEDNLLRYCRSLMTHLKKFA